MLEKRLLLIDGLSSKILELLVNLFVQGKLDFQSYPERLCAADVVPGMINGMMLLRCDGIGNGTREGVEKEKMECELDRMEHDGLMDSLLLHCSDHTGEFFKFVRYEHY